MDKETLIPLLETVRADLARYSSGKSELANACQFAIWHLKGEPSFVERNDKMRKS
jgi:hypothetical protein